MKREDTFSLEEEFALYKFIIENGKIIEYNSVNDYFGDSVSILVKTCKREELIEYSTSPRIINGYIGITKAGLKRYRKRYYLFFLRFLRSLRNSLLLSKSSKKKYRIRAITILRVVIIPLIIGVLIYVIGHYIYDNYF